MRSLLPRERWMIAITLPAVILAMYHGAIRPGTVDRLAAAKSRLEAAAIASTDTDVGKLVSEVAALETEQPALAKKLEERAKSFAKPEQRTELLRRIADAALESGKVVLARSSAVELGEAAPAIARPLRTAQTTLESAGAAKPLLWRMDLRGAYPELRAALERALAVAGPFTPLSLALTHADGARELDLSLWVWL